MIPLMIDFSGKKVVIFGGGEVAARKAAYFQKGTRVVISRSFSKGLEGLEVERREKDLTAVSEKEIRQLIEGAFLVIAATSDAEINDRIGAVCRDRRVLFNNADGTAGDVILPAILEGKNFLIAVATYGRSPGFSRYLRSQLESSRDAFDRMIELQERLRSALKQSGHSPQERRSILTEVMADPRIWEALGEDLAKAWALVEKRYLA
jgi:precorrin-2 dehydrogenase/sirohydrochlorin ferrochelatase